VQEFEIRWGAFAIASNKSSKRKISTFLLHFVSIGKGREKETKMLAPRSNTSESELL
jgi:hypothetical protein